MNARNSFENQFNHAEDLFHNKTPRHVKQKKASDSDPRSGAYQPLPDRLRPLTLDEVIGQEHLTGEQGALTQMLHHKNLSSLILWGGPGVGKTTIARLLAEAIGWKFVQISAVFSGVADLKRAFEQARIDKQRTQLPTVLFVDEIHRFNRAQQDGFLPVVEDGTIILLGATTENPSFSLNGALLSRCPVFRLKRLDALSLENLLQKAEKTIGKSLPLTPESRRNLITMADGDGRYVLNMAEQLFRLNPKQALIPGELGQFLVRRAAAYDRNRDEHYNLISALHKSVRGSDPDAALYWFARMLEGGEDPRYLARRLIRMAVEDIGLADPHALNQATAALTAYEQLGSPEGELALAQLVVYLASSPKSNAAYMAYKAVRKRAKETGSLMPPARILNAPTKMMSEMGYGEGYRYDHNEDEAFSGQNYFPDAMKREQYYIPTDRGMERSIKKRLDHWHQLRKQRQE